MTKPPQHHPWQTTPFKRHLSFYDLDRNGIIYLSESLRANLSLGFDFPVALISAIGLQCYYGNTRPVFFGPLNGIDIARVRPSEERTMLQHMDYTYRTIGSGFTRQQLLAGSGATSWLDKAHVIGLWVLAANQDGMVSMSDVKACREGRILWEVQKRRRGRDDVLPLWRGGPISVAGHSWVVERLFGVRVYQDSEQSEERKGR